LTEGPALDLAWSERCSDQSRALERQAYCFPGCPHASEGFIQRFSCAALVTLFTLGRSRSSRQFWRVATHSAQLPDQLQFVWLRMDPG